MSAYADTGFVVSLYKAETTSASAADVMGRLQAPVWLSQLGELELRNAFHLAVFRGEFDRAAGELKWRLFQDDFKNGVFVVRPIQAAVLFEGAAALADRHSARLGSRSLDLMHVAAALHLKADEFLSFDERQRQVARAEGMKVRP